MEIRFRIPMGAIYCAVVVCVMLLGSVCVMQKVKNERLERELSESRKKIRELEEQREQHADYKPLQCVQYKQLD